MGAPSGIWITWCYHREKHVTSCLRLDFRPNSEKTFIPLLAGFELATILSPQTKVAN